MLAGGLLREQPGGNRGSIDAIERCRFGEGANRGGGDPRGEVGIDRPAAVRTHRFAQEA
jgi:hypothetical protein